MNDTMIPDSRGAYSPWLRMMSHVVWGQWRLLDAQYHGGLAADAAEAAVRTCGVESLPVVLHDNLHRAPPAGQRNADAPGPRVLDHVRE